jgi:hypothetical protein
MSSSWIAVLGVVSVISLIGVVCYRLLRRRPSGCRSVDGGDGGDLVGATSNDGWSLRDWFSSAPATDSSASGGWDNGSGGDSGGGGDGGDGGSSGD